MWRKPECGERFQEGRSRLYNDDVTRQNDNNGTVNTTARRKNVGAAVSCWLLALALLLVRLLAAIESHCLLRCKVMIASRRQRAFSKSNLLSSSVCPSSNKRQAPLGAQGKDSVFMPELARPEPSRYLPLDGIERCQPHDVWEYTSTTASRPSRSAHETTRVQPIPTAAC